MRLGTLVSVFSASPFATRTGGKSTIAREGGAGENAATGSFRTSWLSDEVKTTIHSVEYSIRGSCALWYCARQSLYDRIPSVQDRASCLPESSRRALVADAREIRQYQMHPSSPLRKRDGHPVRRASFFSPGATFAGVLRTRPLKYFRLNSPHLSGVQVCTETAQSRPESLLCGFHLALSSVDRRPAYNSPGARPMNLQAKSFSDMLHRPCFRGVQNTLPC
jgi:hypothetical protein